MKLKNKCTVLACVMLLCSSWAVMPFSSETLVTDNYVREQTVNEKTIKYDFLPENEMPILGYVGVPPANAGNADNVGENPSFITRSNFNRYKEAGFNILSGLYEREPFHTGEIIRAMELAEELGLAYFVNDNALRCESNQGTIEAGTKEDYQKILDEAWYLKEKAFAGIAVKDEPSAQDFDAMANVNSALKDTTEGKILYTNMFPSYVESYRLYLDDPKGDAWAQYVQYVTEFVEKVQPDVLAYDYYAFMKGNATLDNPLGTNNPEEIVLGENNLRDYIKSLSLFRKISQAKNIPYWVSVASFNHRYGTQFTNKQTEWTVNTSLAYGAKGIQYYTYWSGIDGSKIENWDKPSKAGMVTVNGTPHDTYYQVQKINENIKLVDEVLMKSTSKGVIQFGKQVLRLVKDDTLYSYGYLNNISGGDTFVGCFDNNGKTVYYIVNNSINSGRKTFKADFLKKVNVKLTNLDGERIYNDAYSVGFNLSGGQAVLMEVL